MSKVAYSNQPVKSFGGFHFIYGLFHSYSIDKLIDKILGNRAANCKHSYSDAFLGFFSAFLAGGNCMEDLNRMRFELDEVSGAKVCSADTLARIFRDLSCAGKQVTNDSGGVNTVVDNELLNNLLVNMASLVLKNEIEPTLDIDAHILECEKKDGDYTYNKLKGYAPMAAFINRIPVRIQNRSGNTSPAFGHVEFVESTLADLAQNNIFIKYFRADAASYNLDLMEELHRRKVRFYIRAKNSGALIKKLQAAEESEWEKFGNSDKAVVEVAEFMHNGYRLIAQRTLKKNRQYDVFDNSCFIYRAIITNDTRIEMEPADVIWFYNNRGDSERNFEILQNDFGWSKMPLDNISTNTSYLLITAFFMSLYEWVKLKLRSLSDIVYTGMRTKAFLLHFLSIPAKVKFRSRQRIVTFFSKVRFGALEQLLI